MNQMRPTLLLTLRGLPRAVWILCLGTFLNKFGTFVIPFLALYMTRQGFSVVQAGIAIGAYGAGTFIASGLGGHLADTIGRRKTIMLSMFSGAAAMLLLSQARSFHAIVLVTGLAGLTAELYRPASSALLADLVPPGQRVVAFATYRMAFNAGWAFGPATAGFLAEHSFSWLFVGDAATSLLFGLVAFFALPRVARSSQADTGWKEAVKIIVQDRKFHLVLASSLAIAFVFMQMSSTFGLHVTAKGFSSATYGALISLNGVLVVLFELPITTITQRFPARPTMALGYVLIGSGFALNAFSETAVGFICVMLIFSLGEMISVPVSSAYIADLAPPQWRGRYMGAFGFTWSLALMCSPGLGMIVLSRSPFALWMLCGGLGLLAAFTILRKA